MEMVVALASVLAGAKLGKCQTADKFAIIKASAALKPRAEEYNALVKEAQERLRPENWDALVEESKRWDELDEAARAVHNRQVQAYTDEVNGCVAELLAREVEIELPGGLDAEAMGRLLDSNPEWTVGQAGLVVEALG